MLANFFVNILLFVFKRVIIENRFPLPTFIIYIFLCFDCKSINNKSKCLQNVLKNLYKKIK